MYTEHMLHVHSCACPFKSFYRISMVCGDDTKEGRLWGLNRLSKERREKRVTAGAEPCKIL